MLEEYEHAKERGATIIAELKGYGMTSDAADMVNPSIEGASSAMQIALDDAELARWVVGELRPEDMLTAADAAILSALEEQLVATARKTTPTASSTV